MRDALGPPLRAAAWTAFLAAVLLLLLRPPSLGGLEDLLTILAVAGAIVLVTAWLTTVLIGDEMPEPEFRKLVDRSELLAMLPPPDARSSEFDEMVIEAIDDLPPEFQKLLEDTPVVVSDLGAEHQRLRPLHRRDRSPPTTCRTGSSSTRTRSPATSATTRCC